MQPFPWPDALDDMRSHAGYLELPNGHLAVWSRMRAVPWVYVVVGPAEDVLGSAMTD
jgi:hypothetical protein